MDLPYFVLLGGVLPPYHVHLVQKNGQEVPVNFEVVWEMLSNTSQPVHVPYPGHSVSGGQLFWCQVSKNGARMIVTYLTVSKIFFYFTFNTSLLEGTTRYGLLDEL